MSFPNCVPQDIYRPDEEIGGDSAAWYQDMEDIKCQDDPTEWLEDEYIAEIEEKEIQQSAKQAGYQLD